MARSLIDEIHAYWFGDLREDADYFAERSALWFGGSPEADAEIALRFGAALDRAILPGEDGIAPEFLAWTKTPKGTLALLVLVDQFSLQLYREKPQSYDRSALVVPVAKDAIARGFEDFYATSERLFLYLPFEHAENLADQELSVRCFERMAKEAQGAARDAAGGFLDYAERHARVVKRFGRFPDRNEVYGRANTAEETAFLASAEAPF